MADKPQLNITAKLDKKASKTAIQNQLNDISKNLKLTIGFDKTATQEITKQNKELTEAQKITANYRKEINEVVHAYKTQTITAQEALKSMNALRSSEEYSNITKQEQLRLVNAMASADKTYVSSVKETIKTQNEYTKTILTTWTELERLEKAEQNAININNRYKTSIEESKNSAIKNAEALNKYRMSGSQKTELDGYLKTINEINPAMAKTSDELLAMKNNADKASKGVRDLKTSVTASGKSALKFSEYLKNAAVAFSLWISVTTLFFATVRAIKSGVEQVKNLDDAMVELRKVTDLTDSQIKEFVGTAQSLTDEVGRTTSEVVKATAAFSRMGYSIDESFNLAENALLLTNVGDGVDDVNTSTEVLISTMKGFGLEASSARHIIDSLNTVSNKYAVTTSMLASGIQRVASVSTSSGASFEQTLGMLTAMTEVSQNAERSSTALRTLMLRIQGLDEEGQALGDSFKAKFNEMYKSIAGVDIMRGGSLRNIYDVLQDLSKSWDTLSQEQKLYIASESVGIRQSGEFINLLTNFESAVGSTQDSLNSQGSALIENAKYMDSITGKTAQFNAELEKLWTNSINSESIKLLVDFGTQLLKLVDAFGLVNTAIVGVGTAFAVLKSASLIKYFSTLTVTLGGTAVAFSAIAPYIAIAVAATGGLAIIVDALTVSLKEQKQTIDEINSSVSSYKSELASLNQKVDMGDGNDEILKRITLLETLIKTEEERANKIKSQVAEQELKTLYEEATKTLSDYENNQINLISTEKAVDNAWTNLAKNNLGNRYQELQQESSDLNVAMLEQIQAFEDLISSGGVLTSEQQALYDSLLDLTKVYEVTNEETKQSYKYNTDLVSILEKVNNVINTSKDGYQNVSDAIIEMTENGYLSNDMIDKLIETYPELVTETGLTKDAFIDMAKSILQSNKDQAQSSLELLNIEANVLKSRIEIYEQGVKSFVSQRQALGLQALPSSDAFLKSAYETDKSSLNTVLEDIAKINNEINKFNGIDSSRSKSTSSSSSSQKDILDNYKSQQRAISDIVHEITILSEKINLAEGDERIRLQEELIKKYKEQQNAVHMYSEEIRKTIGKGGLSEESLDSLNKQLQENGEEWWSLQNSIKSTGQAIEDLIQSNIDVLTKELADAIESLSDEQIKLYEKENDDLQDQIDALDAKKELQEQINEDLANEQKRQEILTSIAEKQLELTKARQQLSNIQNQKNVRMINATGTGFEFVADPTAVASQMEEVASIENDLSDLNQDLAEHDLQVAQTIADRELQVEKQKLQDKINLNEQAMEDIKNSTEAQLEQITAITEESLANQATLWSAFSANVSSELSGIISKLAQIASYNSMSSSSTSGTQSSTMSASISSAVSSASSTAVPTSSYTAKTVVPTSTVTNNTSSSPIVVQNVNMPVGTNATNFVRDLRHQILING